MEGGMGSLDNRARRKLLEHFLERAALVDLELRSVRHSSGLLSRMRRRGIGLLLSIHQLRKTPFPDELLRLTKLAAPYNPTFLKIVTRTDTPEQLDRLIQFFRGTPSLPFPIAAMGIGKLGRPARRRLMNFGSALAYGSIGAPIVEGQPTLTQLQRDRRAYICRREIRDA
jgi:3-dehydroquinate dehydratase type I